MGGGPSKASKEELRKLEEERDAKKAANDKEISTLRSAHSRQAAMMESELSSRNSDLQKLRDEEIRSAREHDEELRQKRDEQEQRLAKLRAEQEQELAEKKRETDDEKRRVTEKYDQQAADLKEAHDEEMRKAHEQKEEERRRRDQQIATAENERKEVMARQKEAARSHKKELEQKYTAHRKDVNEHWDKLSVQMEQQTKDALQRIADSTAEKLAIVDENYRRVQKDAIETIHNNIVREYLAVANRTTRMKEVAMEMMEAINSADEDEVPYELKHLNSEHNTELSLVDKQMRELKNRMKTCFDISDDFKDSLMKPLEGLEESCSNTKTLSLKVIMAVQKENPKMLESIRTVLEKHLAVTESTLAAVDSLEYRQQVEKALDNLTQKAITR